LNITIELCNKNLSDTIFKKELSCYGRILSGEIGDLKINSIRSGGYVVDTLEAALWCFLKNDNYSNTVLEAVNLGNDTDTTGIVAGSMAGMYYGLNEIPDEWINELVKIDDIKEMCKKFANLIDKKDNI